MIIIIISSIGSSICKNLFMNMHMVIVVGVEFMVAISAPFYCQLCYSFSSNINEAQWHLLSAGHNEKYKVCLLLI